jgi:hypothetical protein
MAAGGVPGELRIAPWILRAVGQLLLGEAVPFAATLTLKADTADTPEARVPHDPASNPNWLDRYGALGLRFLRQSPWLDGGGPWRAGLRASGLAAQG